MAIETISLSFTELGNASLLQPIGSTELEVITELTTQQVNLDNECPKTPTSDPHWPQADTKAESTNSYRLCRKLLCNFGLIDPILQPFFRRLDYSKRLFSILEQCASVPMYGSIILVITFIFQSRHDQTWSNLCWLWTR